MWIKKKRLKMKLKHKLQKKLEIEWLEFNSWNLYYERRKLTTLSYCLMSYTCLDTCSNGCTDEHIYIKIWT